MGKLVWGEFRSLIYTQNLKYQQGLFSGFQGRNSFANKTIGDIIEYPRKQNLVLWNIKKKAGPFSDLLKIPLLNRDTIDNNRSAERYKPHSSKEK